MALSKGQISTTVKGFLIDELGPPDDGAAQLQKLSDAIAEALLEILKNQMIVTTGPGGGVGVVT